MSEVSSDHGSSHRASHHAGLEQADSARSAHGKHRRPYVWLAVNLGLSLIAMYLLMFTMIDSWSDFRNNFNMLYMALTMLAPMGAIMLATMSGMYLNKRLNIVLYAGFALLFAAAFAGIRTQSLIGDGQFIDSMIPHHSGAILMCNRAKLVDAELLSLCETISQGQRREIEQMNSIAARLDGGG